MKIIRNCQIVDHSIGVHNSREDIIFNDEEIIEIVDSDNRHNGGNFEIDINADGLLAFPGLIDIHSHFRDPGETHKEDLKSGSNAAVKGGYTTVVIMPNTHPAIDSPGIISKILNKSRGLPVRIFIAPCITLGRKGSELVNFTEIINEFHSNIFGFSDDGDYLSDNDLLSRSLIDLNSKFPILDHAEDLEEEAIDGSINEGDVSKKHNLVGRSTEAEINAVKRDIEVAKKVNGWIHIQHVSTKKSLDLIKKAKKDGVRVTCEVSPHHLFFSDKMLEERLNSTYKVNPPLRSEKDMKACLSGLKNGVIDVIATDHAPHSQEEKSKPFKDCSSGISWLENSFGLISYKLGYKFACERMSYYPGSIFSDLFGIKLGQLAGGFRPDFTLISDVEWTLDHLTLESKSSNYIFNYPDGSPVQLKGKPVMTIMNGKIVFNSGELSIKFNG